MDPDSEERLVGVDVADPGKHLLIEEGDLDGPPRCRKRLSEFA